MESGLTRWWWIRHAPVAAEAGIIVGALDLPCRAPDPARLAALSRVLPADAVVVTSGLVRCTATAAALGLAGPAEPALAEQHFGAWQGRAWTDLPAAETAGFWPDPAGTRPPGGESFADQVARVKEAVGRLTAAHDGRDIVAVAHAGTIRAALVLALGLEDRPAAALSFAVDPLSLTRIDLMAGGAAVRTVNWSPEP
ncbi:histidine phosphatase family protein [Caenispirillum bisanense]|uniref:Alpha-ribazole phosphatase n=1 Tax=Caenispirillum bisanense TaxID=414052 RepID=A0A286GHU0_9PROT|nr:histidine phosphatase family protein [Caenispirillum bisanense]SOD95101.1 alpha-ribazole phosphatase [Caenispirillum bisanense]